MKNINVDNSTVSIDGVSYKITGLKAMMPPDIRAVTFDEVTGTGLVILTPAGRAAAAPVDDQPSTRAYEYGEIVITDIALYQAA